MEAALLYQCNQSQVVTAPSHANDLMKEKKSVGKAPKSAAPKRNAPAPLRAAAAKSKPVGKKSAGKPIKLPDILLEGDNPPSRPLGGPGQRYALGAATPPPHLAALEDLGELPEAYGTKRLLLAARDPHWLYASWDLTTEQLREYNALSKDGHLVLRIFKNETSGSPFNETHVHPESRNWFVHVGQGGLRFVAQLGYYDSRRRWQAVSASTAVLTPPDSLSEDTSVTFATLPSHVTFAQVREMVKAAAREHLPLLEAIQQLRAAGHKDLPEISIKPGRSLTVAQEEVLAQAVTIDEVRRVWIGSLEITELVRRQLAGEFSSAAAAQFSAPSSPLGGISSVSSPFGGAPARGKGFWFNVNAELIIYGATEPDAEVTIGGRIIKLRPDGSFSYRFALPDGNYELPAIAVSNDKSDARAAELKFSRSTVYYGDVGLHPQDARLKPPLVAHVA
jgi:hypothetical protein